MKTKRFFNLYNCTYNTHISFYADGKTAYTIVYFNPKDVDNMSFDAVISAKTLSGLQVTVDDAPSLSVPEYIEVFRSLDEADEERIAYEGLINAFETYCAYADAFQSDKSTLQILC